MLTIKNQQELAGPLREVLSNLVGNLLTLAQQLFRTILGLPPYHNNFHQKSLVLLHAHLFLLAGSATAINQNLSPLPTTTASTPPKP